MIRSIREGERQHLPKCPDNWRIVDYLLSEDKNERKPDVVDKMKLVHVYDVILDECPDNQRITSKKVFTGIDLRIDPRELLQFILQEIGD